MKDGKLNKNSFVISAVLATVVFLSGCGMNFDMSDKKIAYEQTIEKFVATETKDGKIKTVLEAESAVIKENQNLAILEKPVVKFYEKGKYTSTLTADKGEINTATNDVKALGNCIVDTAEGEHLETSDVNYKHKDGLIFSDSDIKITKANDVIYGKGFESDTDLKNIVIKQQRVILD